MIILSFCLFCIINFESLQTTAIFNIWSEFIDLNEIDNATNEKVTETQASEHSETQATQIIRKDAKLKLFEKILNQ